MYVLYNPMAGKGHGEEKAREIEKKVQGQKIEYRDVTRMDAADFLARLPMEETVVLAGGDGTFHQSLWQQRVEPPSILFSGGLRQ